MLYGISRTYFLSLPCTHTQAQTFVFIDLEISFLDVLIIRTRLISLFKQNERELSVFLGKKYSYVTYLEFVTFISLLTHKTFTLFLLLLPRSRS